LVQGCVHDLQEGVVAGEVVADAEEAGQGIGPLEGEADEAGIIVNVEALGAGARGGAGDDHALQAAKGDADDEDLVVEGSVDGALVEAGEVVGVEGAGVRAVGEAVAVAVGAPTLSGVWAEQRGGSEPRMDQARQSGTEQGVLSGFPGMVSSQ